MSNHEEVPETLKWKCAACGTRLSSAVRLCPCCRCPDRKPIYPENRHG